MERRPIGARNTSWAKVSAGWLAARRVSPNQISVFSVVAAGIAGGLIASTLSVKPATRVPLLILAAGFIELRLLCNMLDGMVAIEGGLQTKSGAVFNELPDRIADALVLVLAGYAVTFVEWGAALGWAAAVLAIMTAYVRMLGGSLGLAQDFGGPMAKPHRMQLMAAACVLSIPEALAGWGGRVLAVALALVIFGSAITVGRRTAHIVRDLESK